jgi:antitoxin YefM
MTIQMTYTQARANLAKLLDRVIHDREVVVIQRRGSEDVALIAAEELSSIMEAAHLLRSPKNAARLINALGRALGGEGEASSLEELRRELGIDPEAA